MEEEVLDGIATRTMPLLCDYLVVIRTRDRKCSVKNMMRMEDG